MAIVLKKIMLTIVLVLMTIWIILYGQHLSSIASWNYSLYSLPGIKKIICYDQAWIAYGVKAWYEGQSRKAGDDFFKALRSNALNIDAWLKLAQLDAEEKKMDRAVSILNFTNQLTCSVVKWKWDQTLLAQELGKDQIFLKNINLLISSYPQFREDALNLIDSHATHDADSALRILDAKNRPFYLDWLIKYQRVEDSQAVWAALPENQKQADARYERYANFLLSQKRINSAIEVWRRATGENGLTNSGFERPLSINNAFNWIATSSKFWNIQRDSLEASEGNISLRITFFGNNNSNFAHVRQIASVEPGATYALTFKWRCQDLTTDQRPFIEINCFQCANMIWSSDMAPFNCDWQDKTIKFTVPEACHAISITLCRRPSERFNCDIKGRLWLDDFHLKRISTE